MGFGGEEFLWRIVYWIPLVLSLTVHEWAHAWSAFKLGDDTASMRGRMTLNPIVHIDPIGTVLLPLLGVPFGWAKPVPVNPVRFRRDVSMRTGMMITAGAGPLANVVIAVLAFVAFVAMAAFHVDFGPANPAISRMLTMLIAMNVILAVFNMLPVPPLDGSRIADGLMPHRFRPTWERFLQLGPLGLLAVIMLPRLIGFSFFDWPLSIVFGWLHTAVALVI